MNQEEHSYRELATLREHRLRNDLARDATLTQLSVGIIAIFATLGRDLLFINRTLSTLLLASFFITILVTIMGFVTSEKLYQEVRKNITTNNYNPEKFWTGINGRLNFVGIISFILGVVFFVTIIVLFMMKG